MLSIIFWPVIAFVIAQSLLALVAELDDQIQGGFASFFVGIIVSALAVVLRIFGTNWFDSASSSFWSYVVLYVPASVFFARKYASLHLITTGSEGSKRFANPLGLSELFLILLLFIGQRFAQNEPSTGYFVAYFVLSILATVIGISWVEDDRYNIWRKDLKISRYPTSGSGHSRKRGGQGLRLLVRLLDWISILTSYIGLPLVVVFLLPAQTIWIWVGLAGCTVAFFGVITRFAIKKSMQRAKLKRDYTRLQQAEQKRDVETLAMALDDDRLSDVASDVFENWQKTDSALFEELAKIYMQGSRGWRLGHHLWFHGVKVAGNYNPAHAKTLVNSLAVKTIPADVRASLLHTMVKDKTFFSSALLQGALPEVMADEELMGELKRCGISLTPR